MTRRLRTFLTFQGGAASDALEHYATVFDDFELVSAERYGPGVIFMPLGAYGFSTRFGWVGDRHGLTWQLNLP